MAMLIRRLERRMSPLHRTFLHLQDNLEENWQLSLDETWELLLYYSNDAECKAEKYVYDRALLALNCDRARIDRTLHAEVTKHLTKHLWAEILQALQNNIRLKEMRAWDGTIRHSFTEEDIESVIWTKPNAAGKRITVWTHGLQHNFELSLNPTGVEVLTLQDARTLEFWLKNKAAEYQREFEALETWLNDPTMARRKLT